LTITLVSAFIPLAFGLYGKQANTVGAIPTIFLGAGTWRGIKHLHPDCSLPAPLPGFLMILVGMLLVRREYVSGSAPYTA
jgi:Na+/pantothenate symporter